MTSPYGTNSLSGLVRVRVRLSPAAGGAPIASFEIVPTSATPQLTSLPIDTSGTALTLLAAALLAGGMLCRPAGRAH